MYTINYIAVYQGTWNVAGNGKFNLKDATLTARSLEAEGKRVHVIILQLNVNEEAEVKLQEALFSLNRKYR